MLTAAADADHARVVDAEAPGADIAPAATAEAIGAAKPFDLEFVSISRREHIELKLQARSFQSLHARAVERMSCMQRRHERELSQAREQVAQLQAELLLARAQIRDLRQRVFGAKTERSRSVNALPAQGSPAEPARRARGQQRGARGHGRSAVPALAALVHEVRETICCPRCGCVAAPAWGSEDTQVLEIDVKAYRRVIRRQRYRPTCRCGCLPGLVTAAAPDILWPRSKLGVSIWVELLLSKFLYGHPTARLLQDWRERGVPIAQGTVAEGLQRQVPLFEPIRAACLGKARAASHCHADETRWEAFEDLPGKAGHRWYLWVFKAERAVCFVLDPWRSAAVPSRWTAERPSSKPTPACAIT